MVLEIFCTLSITFILLQGAAAQNTSITGHVYNEKGEPLSGVTVKAGTTTTSTTPEGLYRIFLPNGVKQLSFSSIGYLSLLVNVDKKNTVDVVLRTDLVDLEDVVVVGYGTVKKRDLTGAIQTLSSTELNKTIPTNILEGMQGRLAGVNVTQNDGAPGAGISIRIRGSNSFLGGTEPLYVVDGVALSNSNTDATPQSIGEDEMQTLNALSFLNPNDIESVTVLKDASATAIYGSRGANGVVIITTKRGTAGKDRIELNLNSGFASVGKKLRPLHAFDYATYQNLAYSNANRYGGSDYELPYPGKDKPNPQKPGETYYAKGPEDYIGEGIDWQDKIFRTGLYQNYSMSLSGGNPSGNHYLSFNYLDQQGTIINSAYDRYNLNLNLQRNLSKKIKLGTNNSITLSNTDGVKTGTDKSDAASAGVIRSVITFPTTRTDILPYSEGGDESFITNPVIYAKDVLNTVKSLNIFSSSFLEAEVYNNLKLRQNIGFHYSSGKRDQYYPRSVYEGFSAKGRGLKADNVWQNMVSETMATFDKKINAHQVNIVGASTFERTNSNWNRAEARVFPNDLLNNENMEAAEEVMPLKGSRSQSTLLSFLGRINYSFDDRYLVTASYRQDGSSKFGKANKWAGFASAALAWKISNERFLRDVKLIDDLKLRISMGQTGNQGIGAYSSLSKLAVYNYPFNGAIQTGLADDAWAGPANDRLKWETTTTYNAGIDAELLDRRLTLTLEAYQKKTENLLQYVTTPASSGFTRQLRNSGSVENKGLEISLGGVPVRKKNIEWTSTFNLSLNRNKILSLGSDVSEQYANNISTGDAPFIQRAGLPIGALYGYVEDGYYDNEAEVRNDPQYTNEAADIILRMIGEVKYKNFDSDPTSITNSDKVVIGDVNPNYTFGFVNNVRFKKLDFSVFVNGVQGNDVINMNTRFNSNLGSTKNITEQMYEGAWQEGADNTDATGPKIMRQYWRNLLFSRRFVEKASFVRIKNITVGYTFDSISKMVNSIRISAGINNLYTFTKYSGFDPEVNSYGDNPALFGVDLGGYPNSRTINFNIQCKF
ncbi:SusC/RagA family TonB-linked outer membrane protein [Sphingobacterium sp. C459-1T]|uniref:SusC/RagA family TonB-linked outer membrane protein n=2 Tax=Sphingobacterium faecale TaxID=2803775 RepID=A0ABS1R3C6_9SPHI|nr:SusC/RagA family TonB-linked outer membrane protein [Sphingobacterium faecale]